MFLFNSVAFMRNFTQSGRGWTFIHHQATKSASTFESNFMFLLLMFSILVAFIHEATKILLNLP